MYTEKSFEKSFLNIVQLFEIEVVPSIKNKVLYSLHILKGFYTSLPKMIVTFSGGRGGGVQNRFFLGNVQYKNTAHFFQRSIY